MSTAQTAITCDPKDFANRAVHFSAAAEDSEPSTPTTIRRMGDLLEGICDSFNGSAEMGYDFSLTRVDEGEVDAHQVRADPFATLLNNPLQRFLVNACGHGDQLVGLGRDDVIAEKTRFLAQLIGPPFIDQGHNFVELAVTYPIPPDTHEHSPLSSSAGRWSMSIEVCAYWKSTAMEAASGEPALSL